MSDAKRCTQCKIKKDNKDFHRDKRKPDGRNSICKICRNNDAKEEKKVKIPKSKCKCERTGRLIFKKDCVPGCNDACKACENPQLKNVKAGGEAVTLEEEREQRRSGLYRSSALLTVEIM